MNAGQKEPKTEYHVNFYVVQSFLYLKITVNVKHRNMFPGQEKRNSNKDF